MNDKVSIIMAAYNAERTIADSIDSVLYQTYTNYELIVVDDCSVDSTASIIKRYEQRYPEKIKIISNTVNLGVSISRYNALQMATGNIIAILDSDDIWDSLKLEKQIRLMNQKKADIVYTGSSFIDENSKVFGYFFSVPETVTYKQLLKQNVISNSSAIVKKELYSMYYVANDNIHEDFALWARILKSGYKAVGLNEPLLIYRISSSSKSGNKIESAKMNWLTYRYLGLNIWVSLYNMIWYTFNGFLKYNRIRKG